MGCMDYVEIPVLNVVLSRCGQCELSEVATLPTAVTMGGLATESCVGHQWRHRTVETLRDPVIMVPEIHIIDENPPIFDLEWMDQCVDKVSWTAGHY